MTVRRCDTRHSAGQQTFGIKLDQKPEAPIQLEHLLTPLQPRQLEPDIGGERARDRCSPTSTEIMLDAA